MEVQFIEAQETHLEECLQMIKDFYLIDNYPFDEKRVKKNFLEIIESPTLGRFYLLVAEDKKITGYLILTFGYSFEYGGRDAFIDEFYIKPNFRNMGMGSTTLSALATKAEKLGVRAIHLEVESSNEAGKRLYEKQNFVSNKRQLLTKILNT